VAKFECKHKGNYEWANLAVNSLLMEKLIVIIVLLKIYMNLNVSE
jgi:hypothetical protein